MRPGWRNLQAAALYFVVLFCSVVVRCSEEKASASKRAVASTENTCAFHCDLEEHKFVFILSAGGRSGSTTLMHMVNGLPNMQLDGEHKGYLEEFLAISKKLEFVASHTVGPFYHQEYATDQKEFYCLIQKWFLTHTGTDCSPGTIHGFKEIRYCYPDLLDFMLNIFPAAKFIFNFREKPDPENLFGTSVEMQRVYANNLKEWAAVHPDQVFTLTLENYTTAKFSELASWLGMPHCKAKYVLHDNFNHSFEEDHSHDHKDAWVCND